MLEFGILGPLVVRRDGADLRLSGARRRALLARLLVEPNRAVAGERLADDLWHGDPPAGATSTLRSHISLLRQVLGPERIQGRDGGYALEVGPRELDADQFEEEARGGLGAVAVGDWATAEHNLERALDRWRGPALAEADGAQWALPVRTRLEGLRVEATEALFESRLALGQHRELCAAAEAAVAEHPLHERLWGQLMLALYRSGRQADALRAFGRLRSVLGEELGIEPSRELVVLEEAILLQKPELDWTGAPARAGPTASGVPLPSRLARRPTVGVIGRDSEGVLIADAFRRVAAGMGSEVVLVSGEAGVGKTTLAGAAARAAAGAGACVLLGRGGQDLGAPYQPLVEALHHYVTHAPQQVLRRHVQSHGGELARMAPALRHRVAELPDPQRTDPDTERYLLFAAVVGLFSEIALNQPCVLVLEDLQWADKPTLLLLSHVVASAGTMRLLVLATYRDTELGGSHALIETLAALHRERGVSRIELCGLDETEVVAFVEAATGHDLDDAGVGLAHAVYRETDGNPFFVGEMLRHLVETGAVRQTDRGRWALDLDLEQLTLPATVHEVVAARVSRLGPIAEGVMSFAAVLGREFDLEPLVEVTKRQENEVLDVLDGAVKASLVREVDEMTARFAFSHALVQRCLYQAMGATRRARAHRAAAEALEVVLGDTSGERIAELAHHSLRAVIGDNLSKANRATTPGRVADVSRALGYSQQAAEAALKALAPDEAVRLFTQSLELCELLPSSEPRRRVELLIGLGTAQRDAGVAASRETLLDAAHQAGQLGDAAGLVAAALANNRGFHSGFGQIDTERVQVLEKALHAIGAVDSPERARLLATLCVESTYGVPFERRQQLADEAKAIARRLSDIRTIARVLNLVELPLHVPHTLDTRLIETAEAMDLATRLNDPVLLYWAATYRRITACQAGLIEEVDRCLALMSSLSDQLRQPTLAWNTEFHGTVRAMIAGDADEAERLAAEALQVGSDSGQPDAFSFYGNSLIVIRWQQGRLNELIPLISQVAAEQPLVPAFKAGLALAYSDAEQPAPALALLNDAAAAGFGSIPIDTAWADAMVIWAEIASEHRAPGPAALIYDLLLPWRSQFVDNGSTTEGPVAHYLGTLATVLGRYGDAELHFQEATEMCERMGARFFGARTDLALGRMLLKRSRSGQRDRATEVLRRCVLVATQNRYATVTRRAEAELSALGAG